MLLLLLLAYRVGIRDRADDGQHRESEVVKARGLDKSPIAAGAPSLSSREVTAFQSPSVKSPEPATLMAYGELVKHGKLQRQERRRFETQKWEVDLAKALELPASIRLERRSGVYSVPGFKYPLVRLSLIHISEPTRPY